MTWTLYVILSGINCSDRVDWRQSTALIFPLTLTPDFVPKPTNKGESALLHPGNT